MSNAPVAAAFLASSFKNRIQNGKFEVSQRGTSAAGAASGSYLLDRWSISYSGAMVGTVTQQLDAPANSEFQYSLRHTITTADTSIAASDYCMHTHVIEGYNVRDLVGRSFVLSFRMRSAKTGIHCVALRNSGSDRSFVSEVTVNAANTWETKFVTVPGGLPSSGTWDFTTGMGLNVSFVMVAGSTFQTTKDAWQTGNFVATANQVNVTDTVGNIFAITGVQLEPGLVPTRFDHRPYAVELAMCQRYYEVGSEPYSYFGGMASITAGYGDVRYLVQKRIATSNIALISWQYYSGGTPTAFTPVATLPRLDRFGFQGTGFTSFAGWAGTGTWAASADF
jgi:hypothetical protein